MRLINADDLIKGLEKFESKTDKNEIRCFSFENVKELLKNAPIAYDAEKVVEQLKEMSGIQFDGKNESYQLDWCIEINRAIEIVRKGGKE